MKFRVRAFGKVFPRGDGTKSPYVTLHAGDHTGAMLLAKALAPDAVLVTVRVWEGTKKHMLVWANPDWKRV